MRKAKQVKLPKPAVPAPSSAPPSAPASLTVAEAILEQLRLWGVKRIYGVVGDTIFVLVDALAKQQEIAFITVKHESVAALMASAEAKLTGKPGVCIAHMGPGLANLLNGLGDAYLDNAPVLAITGQAPLQHIGTDYKQFINQQLTVQAVSSFSELVVSQDAVIKTLVMAMKASEHLRTVAHLSIPEDLFGKLCGDRLDEQTQTAAITMPDPEVLRETLDLMKSAKQPMLLIGEAAYDEMQAAREGILLLAQAWGCGIMTSYGVVGALPESNPYLLNGLGEGGNPYADQLFKKADVVLCMADCSWPNGYVPEQAVVLQLASGSTDPKRCAPVHIRLNGNLPELVVQMAEGLTEYEPNGLWIQEIKRCKQIWTTQIEQERNGADVTADSQSSLHPAAIIRTIEELIEDDAVIALDEGDSTLWFLRSFRAERQRLLLSRHWRTMGFGLPAAMSAKLCLPEKQVICITGDGGLAMVLADLLTAARYQLAITVIVFRNGGLQMEREKMRLKGLQLEGVEIMNPDFVKLAEACGWKAYRAENEEQLQLALRQSRSSGTPVLLDVVTARVAYPHVSN